MIQVEGYRAFRGRLRVRPKDPRIEPFEPAGEFLYKPDTNCWYGCGRSFDGSICEVIEEDKPGWVSVKERLPEALQDVLVYYGNGEIDLDWMDSDGSFLFDSMYGTPPYWMPLPAPPEEGPDE